jgi:hypothetical protein
LAAAALIYDSAAHRVSNEGGAGRVGGIMSARDRNKAVWTKCKRLSERDAASFQVNPYIVEEQT